MVSDNKATHTQKKKKKQFGWDEFAKVRKGKAKGFKKTKNNRRTREKEKNRGEIVENK